MTIEQIIRGESSNTEFKVQLPKETEKYIKLLSHLRIRRVAD